MQAPHPMPMTVLLPGCAPRHAHAGCWVCVRQYAAPPHLCCHSCMLTAARWLHPMHSAGDQRQGGGRQGPADCGAIQGRRSRDAGGRHGAGVHWWVCWAVCEHVGRGSPISARAPTASSLVAQATAPAHPSLRLRHLVHARCHPRCHLIAGACHLPSYIHLVMGTLPCTCCRPVLHRPPPLLQGPEPGRRGRQARRARPHLGACPCCLLGGAVWWWIPCSALMTRLHSYPVCQ
jgi:hypothetical protein